MSSLECAIHGKVKRIHKEILAIELENDIFIHLALFFSLNEECQLPKLDTYFVVTSSIILPNNHGFGSIIVIADPVRSRYVPICPSQDFVENFATRYEWSMPQYETFVQNFHKLKHYFSPEAAPALAAGLAEVTSIANVTCTCVSEERYFYFNCDKTVYPKEFSYYTFGIHPYFTNLYHIHILVGWLSYDKDCDMFWFHDERGKAACIVANPPCDISRYFDNYLVCLTFTFLEELHHEHPTIHAERYLLLDFSGFIKVPLIKVKDKLRKPQPTSQLSDGKQCLVLSKTLLASGDQRNPLLHLVGLEINGKNYLVNLTGDLELYYPFLNVSHIYTVCTDLPFQPFHHNFIYEMRRHITAVTLPSHSHFIAEGCKSSKFLLTVDEAMEQVEHNRLISFEGVLEIKKYISSDNSRTPAVGIAKISPYFGIPGGKTPILQFASKHGPLSLYVNNRQNHVNVAGLIPGMRVICSNVIFKSHYFKSTSITSFHIVQWEPKVPYQTAYIFKRKYELESYMGLGHALPNGIIVTSRILSMYFIHIKLENATQLKVDISMLAEDKVGKFKVTADGTSGINLLKFLLKVETYKCKSLSQLLRLENFFYCSSRKHLGIYLNSLNRDYSKSEMYLTEYFKILDSTNLNASITCRKIDNCQDHPEQGMYVFLDGIWK